MRHTMEEDHRWSTCKGNLYGKGPKMSRACTVHACRLTLSRHALTGSRRRYRNKRETFVLVSSLCDFTHSELRHHVLFSQSVREIRLIFPPSADEKERKLQSTIPPLEKYFFPSSCTFSRAISRIQREERRKLSRNCRKDLFHELRKIQDWLWRETQISWSDPEAVRTILRMNFPCCKEHFDAISST